MAEEPAVAVWGQQQNRMLLHKAFMKKKKKKKGVRPGFAFVEDPDWGRWVGAPGGGGGGKKAKGPYTVAHV